MSDVLNNQPELDEVDTELQQSLDPALLAGVSHQPDPKANPVAVDLSRVYASLDAIQSEGWQRKDAVTDLAGNLEALRRELMSSTDAIASSIKEQVQSLAVQLSKPAKPTRLPAGAWQNMLAGAGIFVLSVTISSAAILWWTRDETTEKLARLGAALHADVAQGKISRASVSDTYKRLGLKVP